MLARPRQRWQTARVTVYYLCHVNDQTAYGGVLVLYRHVDRLNAAGIPAKIVHGVRGFRSNWFANDTAIAYPPFTVSDADLLVIPEYMNPALNELAPGVPKVSINQNAYLTFRGVERAQPHPYVSCTDLLGVLCFSEDSRQYLQHAFPDLEVHRALYSYGGPAFSPPRGGQKRRRIAYMPRKRPSESHQVLSILHARGALQGWEILSIAGMDRDAVSEALRDSALFLAFGEHEGFGMPPVEALASGCYVIGYSGYGGDEYFDPRFTSAVPDGHVRRFAEQVEKWLVNFDADREQARGLAAAEFIQAKYSDAAEIASLIPMFAELVAALPQRPTVSCTLRATDTWLPGEGPAPAWRKRLRRVRARARARGRLSSRLGLRD